MIEKKIVCPKCKKVFTLKAPSLQPILNKTFSCNKCHYAAPFGQILQVIATPKTHIGGRTGQSGPETHVAGNAGQSSPDTIDRASKKLITIADDYMGRMFSLAKGVYILGRNSSDSQASLKLTPDPYMSRVHARLEVGFNPLNEKESRIMGLNPHNPIFINGKKEEINKFYVLKNGDKILMGKTTLTVKL